jgi:hypothetical protein
MTATAGHVFISHGSEDRDEANALSAFIEARGIKTWIAPRDVRPGQDYSEQLQLALEQCAAFVVLVTEKANSSPYVRAETEMAFSNSKPIFPVRQSDIQPAPGLAFFLKIRHWTDAFGKNADSAMERLGQELDRVCGPAKAETGPAPIATPVAPREAPTTPPAPAPAAPALFTPLPEAQTTPPTATVPQMLKPEEEERLTAAIGANAPYYLEKWRRMEAGRTWLSWNWPAFLANIFWLAYRKMWLPLAGAIVLFFLTDFIVSRNPGLVAPGWLFLLLLVLLCGAIGNALYRRQVKALVAKADGLDQPVALAQIRAQGGISVPGLVSTLAVFALLFVAAAVAQRNKPLNPVTPTQPSQQAAGNIPAPVDQPAPNSPPAQQASPAAPGLDASYFVGRWSSDGATDCNSSFNNDGTFTANDGRTGYWRLDGDRLTLTGNTTLVLQVSPIDQNTMTLVNPDGSLIRATRC